MRFCHGVEEELEVPEDPGEGGVEVVGDEGAGADTVSSGCVEGSKSTRVSPRGRGAHGVDSGLAGELADEPFW